MIMGRSIMFVSCCLSICYLASLSLSFSINYEKEKAKIRERIEHIKDPADREEKLLQIAVEDREEAAEKERVRADKFKEEAGELRNQKEDSLKYELLLATRHRIDTLERYLCAPSNITLPVNMDRVKRWVRISQLNNTLVEVFLDTLRKKGVEDKDFLLIWHTISQLCQDTNKQAAHLNIALPEATNKTIVAALKIMGIKPDGHVVKTYGIILEPLPSPFKEDLKILEESKEQTVT